ncbi:unnamed protein product [Vicia faba]|uniref:Reverse transcriptase zinc-binding domain-containing protein n=1 Tax=Vicia faba TaxID=3906 RepID=A0AAV0ZJG5_VICFA|nr:unnamed protein product [Vicia faba]
MLSRGFKEDKQTWNFENDKDYSVKIAHHFLGDLKRLKRPVPSHHVSGLWKKVWKIPLEAKIKNFIWRMGRDILPTRCNLQNKGIDLDPSCPFCYSAPETPLHLFMACDYAKQVCFSSPLGFRFEADRDLLVWLDSVLSCGLRGWRGGERIQQGFPLDRPKNQPSPYSKVVSLDSKTTLVQTDAGCFNDGLVAMWCIIKDREQDILVATIKCEHLHVSLSVAESLEIK